MKKLLKIIESWSLIMKKQFENSWKLTKNMKIVVTNDWKSGKSLAIIRLKCRKFITNHEKKIGKWLKITIKYEKSC